jgi:hypothetical protein
MNRQYVPQKELRERKLNFSHLLLEFMVIQLMEMKHQSVTKHRNNNQDTELERAG